MRIRGFASTDGLRIFMKISSGLWIFAFLKCGLQNVSKIADRIFSIRYFFKVEKKAERKKEREKNNALKINIFNTVKT